MKIIIAQQNYHIGNIAGNTAKIIDAIRSAKAEKADLVIFSELSLCGYPPKDLLYFDEFIEKCNTAIHSIQNETENIAVLIGAPQQNIDKQGKKLFNAAYFLENRSIKHIIQKTCIPTYDVFDEDRYFEPAKTWNIIEYKGKKIAVTICEDIWNINDTLLYPISPMDILSTQHPEMMINLSASPFDYLHDEHRLSIVKANALQYNIPIFYCNTVGSQTDLVFDGASIVVDHKGNLISRLKSFKEDAQCFNIDKNGKIEYASESIHTLEQNIIPQTFDPTFNISQIYEALILGIKDYFDKMGFNKAIIGNSGGIDSAVTIALATAALGKENVLTVLMPSAYSSSHSVTDAVELCKILQIEYHVIPIEKINDAMLHELKPVFKEMPFNVAEENIQSRIRGNILMAIANKLNYILLNTSNKSELATGYGTLYGDMAGGISVLGDCYKLQVYELAKFINKEKNVIPENIISKEPSAELRPNQKDSDSLPDYFILDKILYLFIEQTYSPDAIKKIGFDSTLVDKILRMVNSNEYKRNQFCPIIRISPKSFGSGRRLPIVAKHLS